MYLDYLHGKSRRQQQGFLLPLALFLVVVMGLLALVLMRSTQQTGMGAVQETVSVAAFYAAESGAQQGMQTLFYNNDLKRQSVDGRCAAMNATFTYTANGINNCSAVVTCTCVYSSGAACASGTAANYAATTTVSESYYTVVSTGSCGVLPLKSTRTIQAGSFLKQE
jgi:MSHA biogenesis protein MshP